MSQPSILSFTEMAISLSEIHQAHAHMLKTGHFHNTFSANKLLAFAVTTPDPQTLTYAHSIFSRISSPNSYTFNAIIRAYANSPTPQKSLSVFQQMLDGPVCPDKYSFTFALKACAGFGGIEEGKQIHGHVLKIGIGCDLFVANTLIHVYAQSGFTQLARNLLARMPERDTVSWNALLSAYVEMGSVELARQVFDEMEERNVESWNFMISGYASAGLVEKASEIFYAMPLKNVVSWNAMITGYAHASCFSQVLELFEQMQSEGVKPDNCTLVNVLSACARVGALSQGEWLHGYIKKNEIGIGGFLATALIDMYSKCGNIDKALQVFKTTRAKDVSTWNSLICGLSIHGFGEDALQVFNEMLAEDFKPNEVTFISILSACSRTGLLHEMRNLFDLMVRVYRIEPTVEHYGCMVDLLGRVGLLQEAEELVETISIDEASVVLESLLGACRNHGNLEVAERVSRRLLELNPQESAGYVQMSNIYTSVGRWNDAMEVRRRMRAERVNKKPGCSIIEVNGTIHEFLAGEGIIFEQI
ncbi:pentatricopeptide repeat-containing protein At4g18840 [Carica papaya]|uniref:pentatricopeptide repeat-containing protein At4g18840 n=1 Tax=Carica papaya TaxID=3649 RepID=UPI000B8D1536|nr:pentatricopeptide repeat-containing protein At4g18840 [Carica papaya]XP_021890825.1 pentatricopeptide repeat-containing protein At4g18840 [Carica papaya]